MASRVPWPLDKGDKLRMYYQIKNLSIDNDIFLVAISNKKDNSIAESELLKFCKQVDIMYQSRFDILLGLVSSFFNSKPLQIGYFYNKSIVKKINELVEEINPDHVYGQLIRVAEYINGINRPKTLDLQDAFSAGLLRRVEKTSGLFKFVLKMEYKRVLEYETNALDSFDFLTIITQVDKNLLNTKIQQKLSIVPNGVDMEFFKPMNSIKKVDIVFTGNMSYPPNVNAAIFLVEEIMPIVWKSLPDAKLMIAGASPTPKVKSLGRKNVEVSGWLEDIRDAYSQSKVFIAPMQIGTGLQNKLLEAMAMKVPCITSDLANNALKAKVGKEILVANKDDADSFAMNIVKLLNDNSLAKSLSEGAYIFVERNYNWKVSVDILNKLWNK